MENNEEAILEQCDEQLQENKDENLDETADTLYPRVTEELLSQIW